MNTNFRRQQNGASLNAIVIILGAIIIAVLLFRPQIVSLFSAKPTKISVQTVIDHTSELFRSDQYYMMIAINHLEENPLTGGLVLVVKGPGHIRPLDSAKQTDGEVIDEHTVRFMVKNWEPGKANSRYFYFDLSSPNLNENGLSSEEVQKRILVRIEAMFGRPGERIDQTSTCNFTVGQ